MKIQSRCSVCKKQDVLIISDNTVDHHIDTQTMSQCAGAGKQAERYDGPETEPEVPALTNYGFTARGGVDR